MIAVPDMERMVRRYLRAARFLNRANANDPDAAIYLCGYAVEIALKVRICMVLGRVDFPETASEFRHTQMQAHKTHDLEMLLLASGWRPTITNDPVRNVDWSIVTQWNSEHRYRPAGTKTRQDAYDMIEASEKIVRAVL
jgi:hypothetical protein